MVRMAERIRTQIQNTWIFRMTGQGPESVLMNLVEARLQLFALVCAVFKNPLVQRLASNISDDEVALHASRFLETLDSPELDGIYPILVELFEPRKACIEKFLRTVQADFELRPRRGIAIPSGPAATDPRSTQLPIDCWADDAATPGRLPDSILPRQIWPIADALSTALGYPSWRVQQVASLAP